MWNPGDDFEVVAPMFNATIGQLYTIMSTYSQGIGGVVTRYYTFVGDMNIMSDVSETSLNNCAKNMGPGYIQMLRVNPVPSNQMLVPTGSYIVPPPQPIPGPKLPNYTIQFPNGSFANFIAETEEQNLPKIEPKQYKCVCGATSVGMSSRHSDGHSSYCDIVTKRESL